MATTSSKDKYGFGMLKQLSRDSLIHLLESFPGKKDLILDPKLMKMLDRVAGVSILRNHGVDKIFKFEINNQLLPVDADQIVFMVRPTPANCKQISNFINSKISTVGRLKFVVVFVPRRMQTCELILEQEGVFGHIRMFDYPELDFVVIDESILSLELPEFYTSFYLDQDHRWLHTIAHSLFHLQTLYGPFQNTYSIGSASEKALQLCEILIDERNIASGVETTFNNLFIVDRDIDYVPCFMSCLTFESLLDEVYGINCGFCDFPQNVKLLLTADDDIFHGVRYNHFSNTFSHLSMKWKAMRNERDMKNDMSVSDLKNFVRKDLKNIQLKNKSVETLFIACEAILKAKQISNIGEQLEAEHSVMHSNVIGSSFRKEIISYVEDLMCQQVADYIPLCLICLLSVTEGGLTSKDFQSLRTQFLQAYGHKHLVTFANLKKLGIVFERERPMTSVASYVRRPPFQALCKRFNLLRKEEDVNIKNPTDMSYIYNGAYTPLIPQLIAQILQNGFQKEELSKCLFCPLDHKKTSIVAPLPPSNQKKSLVYFVGGVTYAEIACLNLLAEKRNLDIAIAATHITSRENFVSLINR